MELRLVYPEMDILYSSESGVHQVKITDPSKESVDRFWDQQIVPGAPIAVHSKHFTLIPCEIPLSGLGLDPLVQLGMSPETPFGTVYLPYWEGNLLFSLESVSTIGPVQESTSSIWQPLLKYFAELVNQMNAPVILIHLTTGHSYIMAGGKDKLHFFNSFSVREPADLLYFTLKTLQEWKKSPESTPVRLSGHFETDSPVYVLLTQYLGDLGVAPSSGFVLDGLDAYPPHRFIDLSSFAACASSAAS